MKGNGINEVAGRPLEPEAIDRDRMMSCLGYKSGVW